MSVKINSLELENVKRIKAVKIEPTENGLTVIGGNNNQGKTSVLDAIAWALGGDRFKPSAPARDGSTIPPHLHIKLTNGIEVERKGKNSDLKVTDPSGRRGGQQLLNEFIEQLALDLPKFMSASGKEKADTLLKIIGVGDKLYELETEEQNLYNQRHAIGQIADQKAKFAREMQYFEGVPDELITATDLIKKQQEILARNGLRQQWQIDHDKMMDEAEKIEDEIDRMSREIAAKKIALSDLNRKIKETDKSPSEVRIESTAEIEKSISEIEEINVKIRANLDKEKAEDEAKRYRIEYEELTEKIKKVRADKSALLDGADLPLRGLSVTNGELTYKGQKWDNMSSSQQMIVATAIIRKLNPECGFVLLDKLEQMDIETMKEFGKWLEGEGLQAIATRVSTGDECSVIIEDGYAKIEKEKVAEPKKWTEGEF